MSGPLRVAVNLTWLSPGRVGGSEEYLVRQLLGVPADSGVEATLYCQPSLVTAHPELSVRFAIDPMPFERDWRPARIAAEHSWLVARTRGADLAHHGGGTAPLAGVRPNLVTVHDLQYLAFPSYFSAARRSYLDRMMPRSVRGAALVATPSEYVRGRVVKAFGVDAERVVVVPHGIPEIALPDADEVEAVRSRYGLGERPFVVYPAITHPHKRHGLLVEALEHLDPALMLVLIGGAGPAEPALRRAIAASPVADRVVRPGRVDPRDRDVLMSEATALAFPSEYEGFGAPLVEAMALGTPVVCSDQPAVREVVADAGLVVGDNAPRTWAAAIEAARREAADLVSAGRRRREAFTLAGSGGALVGAYRRAAGA